MIEYAEDWDGKAVTLTLRQTVPPTPGQPEKQPMLLPVAVGAVHRDGSEAAPTTVFELSDWSQKVTLPVTPSDAPPILSVNRGFAAPVIVRRAEALSIADQLVLLAHDSDAFNRWEVGRSLAKTELARIIDSNTEPNPAYLAALGRLIGDDALDPAFRAFALGLPSEDDMAQTLYDSGRTPDPARIHAGSERLKQAIGSAHALLLERLFGEMEVPGPYRPVAEDAGKRALRLRALSLLSHVEGPERARALHGKTDNMTEALGTLAVLLRSGDGETEAQAFYDRWKDDPNTLDKWFAMLVGNAHPDRAVEVAEGLVAHDAFNVKNPNRFRAVIGGLAGNTAGFHHASGEGYAFVAKWLKKMDAINPMTAARMATVFETLTRYDGDRQGQMRDALEFLLDGTPSKNVGEIAGRILGR